MINSKEELKDYIALDCCNFPISDGKKGIFIAKYVSDPFINIKRFTYYLRRQEYYINTAGTNKLKKYLGLFYEKKKNKIGLRLGIEIGPNSFGKGLTIWHSGSIIVNSNARIGDFCTIHGNVCIGNNGKDLAVPKIGNNVDIGYGAVIIGGIKIVDNVRIGANAVVRESVLEPGSVVVGVPARRIGS